MKYDFFCFQRFHTCDICRWTLSWGQIQFIVGPSDFLRLFALSSIWSRNWHSSSAGLYMLEVSSRNFEAFEFETNWMKGNKYKLKHKIMYSVWPFYNTLCTRTDKSCFSLLSRRNWWKRKKKNWWDSWIEINKDSSIHWTDITSKTLPETNMLLERILLVLQVVVRSLQRIKFQNKQTWRDLTVLSAGPLMINIVYHVTLQLLTYYCCGIVMTYFQ